MKTKATVTTRTAHPAGSDANPLLPPPPDAHRYRAERPGKRRRVFNLHLQRALLALLLLLMLLALFARP